MGNGDYSLFSIPHSPFPKKQLKMSSSRSNGSFKLTPAYRERAIKIYLREIGAIPLLNREEEKTLARMNSRGDEEARRKLIRSNLRLVVKISKKYEHLGLPLLDLIEEGNLGLIKGVERYKLGHGTKVSTYAAWWIRQSIMRALANKGKMIRIPVYMQERVNSFKKNVTSLSQKLRRPPSNQEISEELGLTLTEIDYLKLVIRIPSSLDSSIDREGVSKLVDMIQDTDALPPDVIVDTADLHQELLDLIQLLPAREIKILQMRFGLGGGEPRTLSYIGEEFGISRERIRQIINKSIRELRHQIRERERETGV
ncbi:MAG: RNA polymerase sigma factor RpoD/SigA [Candidatus Auribacterota bacterium]|nr:RNA polymerase sigma factor RpoD/SigA [Candidatus Auribacterota bacterium]